MEPKTCRPKPSPTTIEAVQLTEKLRRRSSPNLDEADTAIHYYLGEQHE